jgi:hypothetical protein
LRSWDDVEVVRRAIVLVVLGTVQEFVVVHDPEIRSLNGVVGVKGVGNPVFAVIVSTSSYLHFISYAVMLASFSTIGLDQRRLSSCIVSWMWGGIPLDVQLYGDICLIRQHRRGGVRGPSRPQTVGGLEPHRHNQRRVISRLGQRAATATSHGYAESDFSSVPDLVMF